jgi:hypothetical protein
MNERTRCRIDHDSLRGCWRSEHNSRHARGLVLEDQLAVLVELVVLQLNLGMEEKEVWDVLVDGERGPAPVVYQMRAGKHATQTARTLRRVDPTVCNRGFRIPSRRLPSSTASCLLEHILVSALDGPSVGASAMTARDPPARASDVCWRSSFERAPRLILIFVNSP